MNHKQNQSKTTPAAEKATLSEREKSDLEFRTKPKSEQLAVFQRYADKYSKTKNFVIDSVIEYDLLDEYLSNNNYRY